MERQPTVERTRRPHRDPQEVLAGKLERLRSNPFAQVLLVSSPEVGAFSGVLFGLDRGLGLLKQNVPHILSVEDLQELLRKVRALNTQTEEVLSAHGLVPAGTVETERYDRVRLVDREQEARHPRAQVFIPHHDETHRMAELLRGVNSLVSRARASLSIDTQEVKVFEQVYELLEAYDRQVQDIFSAVRGTGYRTPRFLQTLRSRGLGANAPAGQLTERDGALSGRQPVKEGDSR